jgi:glycogen operon protein
MDSMRYWLTEMHADGFRFDLAPTLARQDGNFDQVSAFLDMVSQDPGHDARLLAQSPVGLGEFATRFCGSSDLYAGAHRRPTASVNLITVHDGFTLRDLVSCNDKHNEAKRRIEPRRDQ